MNESLSRISNLATVLGLAAAIMVVGLTGCNTTQGFGEDVEAAGDVIEDAAEEAEDELD